MIHIEDVTDADAAPHKQEAANPAPAAEEAKASEQTTSPAIQSPETDANVDGSEQEVSASSEEDMQVSADAALQGQCHMLMGSQLLHHTETCCRSQNMQRQRQCSVQTERVSAGSSKST